MEAQHGESKIYVFKAELKMDASEIVKELECWVLCWLLRGIEPGRPRQEFDATTTTSSITTMLQIIATCQLAISAENRVKF